MDSKRTATFVPATGTLRRLASSTILGWVGLCTLAACGGGAAPDQGSQGGGAVSASSNAAPPTSAAPSFGAASLPSADARTVQQAAMLTNVPAVLTDAVFAPSSFWYTPIPASVTLHANTAGFQADFLRQKQLYYGTVNINTYSYASPVYIAADNAPTSAVVYSNCQHKFSPETALAAQWTAVPIPPYALPSDGSDAEMTIYQPSTNTLWEFWVSRNVSGQWQACWGGKMSNTNTGDGRWTAPYGATATGLPFLGGQVTAEELARGEIHHAIGISLVEVEAAGIVSWPATRSDGVNPTLLPNRIPEGLRFRLDPSINVDALALSSAGKVIAKAAQKYGFVVWDKAGALSIRVQNPKSYTALGQVDPYVALFGGKPSYAVLNGFPWERLQFLPMDYGKP